MRIVNHSDKNSQEASGATSLLVGRLTGAKFVIEEMYMYQEIAVTSFYFAKGNIQKSFPRRIETQEGRQINFIEDGLRCVINRGQDLLEIFMMSDGQQQYKLGFEPLHNSWKLLSTRPV